MTKRSDEDLNRMIETVRTGKVPTIEQQDKWHQAGYEDGQRAAWAEVQQMISSHLTHCDFNAPESCLASLHENFRRRTRQPDHQEEGG